MARETEPLKKDYRQGDSNKSILNNFFINLKKVADRLTRILGKLFKFSESHQEEEYAPLIPKEKDPSMMETHRESDDEAPVEPQLTQNFLDEEKSNKRNAILTSKKSVHPHLQKMVDELDAALGELRKQYKDDPVALAREREKTINEFANKARDAGFKIKIVYKDNIDNWVHNAMLNKSGINKFKPSSEQLENMIHKLHDANGMTDEKRAEVEGLLVDQAKRQGIKLPDRDNHALDSMEGDRDRNITPEFEPKESKNIEENKNTKKGKETEIDQGTRCEVLSVTPHEDGSATITIKKYGKSSAMQSMTISQEEARGLAAGSLVFKSKNGVSITDPTSVGKNQDQSTGEQKKKGLSLKIEKP